MCGYGVEGSAVGKARAKEAWQKGTVARMAEQVCRFEAPVGGQADDSVF